MSIEKLRKFTKFKVGVSIVSAALPLVIVSILEVLTNIFDAPLSVLPDLMAFRYTLSIILEAYLVIKLVKYTKILRNDEFANQYLLEKNDERNNFIKVNAYATAIRISFMTLMFIMIVAAFINRYVFYTILAVFIIQIATYYVVKLIYNRKY
jgi:flagellar biosynthesis protein FliQ